MEKCPPLQSQVAWTQERRVEGDVQILEIRKTNPGIQKLMKEFLHVDSMILRPLQNQEKKFP